MTTSPDFRSINLDFGNRPRVGDELTSYTVNDVPLQLRGELTLGGYDIQGVYVAGSNVNILGLFSSEQIASFENFCDIELPSIEQIRDDIAAERAQDERRDARL